MEKYLFIAEYPNSKNIKDGMIKRIYEVDKSFKENKRTYLNIKFLSNFKKEKQQKGTLMIYNLNFFKHIFLIKKIIKRNKNIYLHSLLNYTKVFFLIKKKNIILDVHGAVVEEMAFNEKKLKSKILSYLEKELFKKLNVVIFVNKKMKSFYETKYLEEIKNKGIIYPILDYKDQIKQIKQNNLKGKVKGKQVFIYSGNLQKWQNIDLMLKKLKEIENENYFYIFLTGEPKKMNKKLKEYKIKNYYLDSVTPEELFNFYELSNYGIILRDEHTLNKVANPTKLTEYLEYGMIPIVKFSEIGDYKELGYEYIKICNLNKNMKDLKSLKNIEIIKKIRDKYKSFDIKKEIEERIK